MNRKPSRLRTTSATLLFVLACTTTAYAAPPDAPKSPAAAHAKKAGVAYNLSDWQTAIKEYRAAYAAEQKPAYLFGLAQAERQSGDCASAIDSYKAFKRGNVSANQATAAELLITKCQAQLEQEKAKKELARARAEKAKQKQARAPSPKTGTEKPANKPAPPPPAPDTPTPWYKDAFGHVLFIAGAGTTAAGAVFLVNGNSQVSDTSGGYDNVLVRQDSGKKKQVLGVGGLVVGGALIAGAILRYALVGDGQPSNPEHDQHASVYGFAGPHRAELGLTGRF